jgi:Ca2+-binding RTX toxin-like protein
LFDGQDPRRASDHDPVVVGVRLGAGCACDAPSAIVGSADADVLIGTLGDDTICGRGGADVVFGRGGNDCIVAGSGPDWVFGAEGQDWIDGGPDSDRLAPGADRDRVLGGEAVDGAACENGDACSAIEHFTPEPAPESTAP